MKNTQDLYNERKKSALFSQKVVQNNLIFELHSPYFILYDSSYVGGTINFFATAQILTKATGHSRQENLLGAMAAADVAVMAVYFSFLAALADLGNSSVWRKVFPSFSQNDARQNVSQNVPEVGGNIFEGCAATVTQEDVASKNAAAVCDTVLELWSATLGLCLCFGIVQISNVVEKIFAGAFISIPGMSTMIVAVLSPVVGNQIIRRFRPNMQRRFLTSLSAVSTAFFLSIFSSMGVSVDIAGLLSLGTQALCFASLALAVHVVGLGAGALLINRFWGLLMGSEKRSVLGLDEIMVASNAGIGGASTAAIFAGRIVNKDNSINLALAGTLWGVIGYCVGTPMGVTLSHHLAQTILNKKY